MSSHFPLSKLSHAQLAAFGEKDMAADLTFLHWQRVLWHAQTLAMAERVEEKNLYPIF